MELLQKFLSWSRASRLQKWSCGTSIMCYVVGYILLAYIKSFHYLREHAVLMSFGVLIGWPAMLCLLKGINWVESKVNRGTSRRVRVGCLVLQLVLMVIFNVGATILSEQIIGELGIWASSFMLASISLMEIMLMEDNDYGLADMVQAILLGATSSMVTQHLVLYPVSALCCIRKAVVFAMKESKYPVDAVASKKAFIGNMKKDINSSKTLWMRTGDALGYDKHVNGERFEEYNEMGNIIEHMEVEIQRQDPGDEEVLKVEIQGQDTGDEEDLEVEIQGQDTGDEEDLEVEIQGQVHGDELV